jgi:hypothetical protein
MKSFGFCLEHEFSVGGNAALIAQYFASQNVTVLLGNIF